jgi:hypothetical protein
VLQLSDGEEIVIAASRDDEPFGCNVYSAN